MQSRWDCFWNSPFLQEKCTLNGQVPTAGQENHTDYYTLPVYLINKSILLCLLLLPSTASIAALNEEETRGWKKEWEPQVMSCSIINLISESYFSVPFSSMFCIGMSFKLWFCCKRQTEGTTLGCSLAQPWAGGRARPGLVTWGRAELPLHCARAHVCPMSLCVPPSVCPTLCLSHVLVCPMSLSVPPYVCPTQCLSHAIRRGYVLSPMQLSPTPFFTWFLQTLRS